MHVNSTAPGRAHNHLVSSRLTSACGVDVNNTTVLCEQKRPSKALAYLKVYTGFYLSTLRERLQSVFHNAKMPSLCLPKMQFDYSDNHIVK
ncbi:MAG: hypothetical protein ACUZ8H_16230 [Candidatus Anammoxibacter sp.]